ncbi:MAG TPA: caspase family protein [Xanthobacteraceae bacterium]
MKPAANSGLARQLALAAALLAAFLPRPAAAEVHAIVAGFNDYAGRAKLGGAVADANDIAAVLARRGVRDLVKMTDGATSVANFRSQFDSMVARAKSGDLIMFTFSGHGIRAPEKREPKRTPDGYDKGFLFPTYDQNQRPDEILRDEDLYDLFKTTAARGLHILFVVDACHAGTGLRSADSRGGGGAFKFQQFDLEPGAAPVVPPKQAPGPRPPIPGAAAITAQLAEKTVQELPIDGSLRGALSYAVARGLDGAADPNRTGTITLDMLWQYIRPQLRVLSETRQVPTLFAREADGGMPVLTTKDAALTSAPASAPAGLPDPETTLVFAIGSPSPPSIRGGAFVTDRARADLIWDAGRKQILNAPGDVLASDIEASGLQGAIDVRRLLAFLRKLAGTTGALEVKVARADAPPGTSDDRLYKDGEKVRFEVATGPYKFLTAFDVNSDGTVQFLYPSLKSDPLETSSSTPLASSNPVVGKPFGADYAVFIRSEEPLSELHAAFLRAQNATIPASQAYDLIRGALRGTHFRVGIQGLFTCRKIMENGQCDSMLGSR